LKQFSMESSPSKPKRTKRNFEFKATQNKQESRESRAAHAKGARKVTRKARERFCAHARGPNCKCSACAAQARGQMKKLASCGKHNIDLAAKRDIASRNARKSNVNNNKEARSMEFSDIRARDGGETRKDLTGKATKTPNKAEKRKQQKYVQLETSVLNQQQHRQKQDAP